MMAIKVTWVLSTVWSVLDSDILCDRISAQKAWCRPTCCLRLCFGVVPRTWLACMYDANVLMAHCATKKFEQLILMLLKNIILKKILLPCNFFQNFTMFKFPNVGKRDVSISNQCFKYIYRQLEPVSKHVSIRWYQCFVTKLTILFHCPILFFTGNHLFIYT